MYALVQLLQLKKSVPAPLLFMAALTPPPEYYVSPTRARVLLD